MFRCLHRQEVLQTHPNLQLLLMGYLHHLQNQGKLLFGPQKLVEEYQGKLMDHHSLGSILPFLEDPSLRLQLMAHSK